MVSKPKNEDEETPRTKQGFRRPRFHRRRLKLTASDGAAGAAALFLAWKGAASDSSAAEDVAAITSSTAHPKKLIDGGSRQNPMECDVVVVVTASADAVAAHYSQ